MKKIGVNRAGNRKTNQLRKVKIETNVNIHAEGSVLISMGNTRVICTASHEERVPPFMRGKGKGWVAAEYSMLPRATNTRSMREVTKGKASGRTMEIQRLIGRAMRSVVKMEELGERSIMLDCDTIQADGGTRTASITGAFVALCLALHKLKKDGIIETIPLKDYLAAVSVGIVDGTPMLDLDYKEDFAASTDMNIVMTGKNQFVEIQGTAEEDPFSAKEMESLVSLAQSGIKKLIEEQKKVLPKSFRF